MGHSVRAGEIPGDLWIGTSAASAIAAAMLMECVPADTDKSYDHWTMEFDNDVVQKADEVVPHEYEAFLKWLGRIPTDRPHFARDFVIAREFIHKVALTNLSVHNSP